MPKKFFFAGALIIVLTVLLRFIIVSHPSGELVSPLSVGGRIAANLWFPEAEADFNKADAPEITAKAAYFVEINSGRILYQKAQHQKLPIASLTKIMTAIVALESRSWADTLTVSNRAAQMEPDSMLLRAEEKLTVEELLYGIFLVSANDAAEVLAETVTNNRESFISLMNSKATQLGMKETLFANPTGLDEDEKSQYSTAYDVALMSRYAIKNFPHLVDISSTPHIILPQTQTHQDYDLYSGINLLTTYPGVRGLKTGYTPSAGLTLVTLAEREGHTVLGVLLGSENRREEAKQLLDYSFSRLTSEDN